MEWLSPITQAFVRAAALSLVVVLSPAVAIASTEAPGQYFLVIDHSGSMLTPISKGPEAGRSRWNLMRERAADFVDRLPAGADVWAIIFSAQDPSAPDRHWNRIISARLDSPARRDSVTALLKGYPEPGLANGTWLYQATNAALDQVEIAGSRDPDAYLTVLVYTDGVDEGHGRTRAEMLRNPGSQVTRAQTETRIRALRQRYRNFNVVNVYQPGDESIRDAQVIRLLTNRLQLASPLVLPRQELTIALSFRDSEHLRLVGRPVTLSVETEDGRGLPLRILGAPLRLSNAPMKVVVERAGDWPAGRDVEARLSIGYPELPGVLLVAEGGNTSKLFIQGAEAPSIRDLLPASNAVFPVGREVTFSLTTLPEARVDWDFGDGRSATGNPVTHTFTEPGKRTVSVKVTDPRTQLTASATVQLGLAKIAIGLDPFPAAVVPQREVTLTASAEGNFARFEWNVGGRLYAGKPRADGVPGTSLAVTFDRAGPVAVSVAGEGINGGRVEAPPETLEVKEVPALRVTSPADRDALYFDSTREFRAEVEGIRAERVRFTLLSSAGEVILESKEVDVQQQGPLRVAVVEQVIPRLSGRVAGVLRAETVGAEPALRRDIPVVIEREPVIVEIMLPDGREPHIHRPTSMRLRANATLEQVRWDFGEGDGFVDGAEVEQHVWKAYGDYVLRAVARDPEGNEIEAPPIAIKVPVRPVAARAVLVYDGAAVGVDTARVPLNATLGLQADVVGDVLRVRWLLDGEELPAGTETITTTKRGVRIPAAHSFSIRRLLSVAWRAVSTSRPGSPSASLTSAASTASSAACTKTPSGRQSSAWPNNASGLFKST